MISNPNIDASQWATARERAGKMLNVNKSRPPPKNSPTRRIANTKTTPAIIKRY
jgi:hypothetical protein